MNDCPYILSSNSTKKATENPTQTPFCAITFVIIVVSIASFGFSHNARDNVSALHFYQLKQMPQKL